MNIYRTWIVVTWIILWTEFVVETAERSVRRQRYFIGQNFDILGTEKKQYTEYDYML